MAKLTDLTGAELGAWRVVRKAAPQNRVQHWTAAHACGVETDLPHTMLLAARDKGGTLPPCPSCTSESQGLVELPAVSHGQHLACGKLHVVGGPCPDRKAGPGECKHGVQWRACPECAAACGLEPIAAPAARVPDLAPFVERAGIYARPATAEQMRDAIVALTEALDEPRTLDLECHVAGYDHGAEDYPDDMAVRINAEFCQPASVLDLDALMGEPDAIEVEMPAAYVPPPRATVEQVEALLDELAELTAWSVTDEHAPPATLNREFRDVLLAPMYKAMAGHERNAQVQPGPSAVGGCRRKLAYQLLFADEFVAEPSGWAATKGTVLHAWYDTLCSEPGWFSDLALPPSVASITGGKLDLYVQRTVVDLKAPGTTTMRNARAGRLSNGYFTQTQVYGLGAEALGLVVEKVGLLFVPMCGDNLDDAIYWEWPYDRAVAQAALADAERIVELGRTTDRVEVLASMPIKSDFCQGCPVFGKHCAGAKQPKAAAPVSLALELVRP